MQKIDEKTWDAVRLTEIFDTISRGKRIKKSDHIPGKVPYVSSTALVNGTDGSCDNEKGVRKFEDCLTIANSGSVGSCFYHPYEFVASDHVTALRRDGTSADCYLGLSALVGRLGEKYNFNREINDVRISRERVMLALFMEKKLSYEDLCKQIEIISIEFLVDYSLDDPDDNLGALSPFIIDVDVDTTTALIRAEYRLKTDEKTLWTLLESSYYKDGAFSPSEDAHKVLADNFGKLFGLTVYAINPNNQDDKQVKSHKELHDLFPFHAIPAERVLGEDDTHKSSLGSLISGFFDTSEAELDPDVAEEIKRLRSIVEKANNDVQKQSDEILSSVVNNSIGFGYPNIEELKLGVTTQLSIDDQIKNQTKLSYISGTANESLPSSHNGLGYKNLIKMEFLLAAFAKDIKKRGVACVPLLFIEEPESHMHPQMQTAFAAYLEKFLSNLSTVKIQTFLTSHSSHIANTMEFAKVRYAQKSIAGVIYKNLNTFAQANPDNVDFIRKYLTLTKCDLFFADKAIFVEGACERLLLPDMIEKCETAGVFGSCKYPLSAQYYALIEIGGAYAHKFIPFIEFLGVSYFLC